MATNFPTSLDTFVNPGVTDKTNGSGPGGAATQHHTQHANINDAVAALEAKVGINSSTDAASIDNKLTTAIATLATKADLVSGKVPSSQLPSYVDDVLEFANLAAFPGTGETGKIYIADDTNAQYRWSGSAYIEIVAAVGTTDAITEGSTNLFFTAARVRAVVLTGLSLATNAAISAADTILTALGKLQKQITDHLADTGNPHAVTSAQVGLGNVDNTSDVNKPVSTAQGAADAVVAANAAADATTKANAAAAGAQPLDATLTALAGVNWSLNAIPIGTGTDTVSQVGFSANTFPARSSSGNLIAKAITDASLAALATGLGTVATLAIDTDGTLAANSDTNVPSQKAVKTFLGNAVTGLLKFKGSTDCSANPNYPAASKGDSYVVSVAGKIGGASGLSVDVGDMYAAEADNAGGTQASVGSSWFVLEHNLVGALLAANNLSDVANAATARTNLGLATVAASGSASDLTTGTLPAAQLPATAQLTYFGTATGTNTYAITLSPVPGSYITGVTYTVVFTNANTGASTLNLNGLGAKTLQLNNAALAAAAIPAGATLDVVYDGTNLQIIGASASGGGGGSSLFTIRAIAALRAF